MPSFGKSSLDKLGTCDERLQRVFKRVVQHFDCTVICGERGEIEQNKAFAEGKSTLRYPEGKHNKTPSLAIDVMPYPLNWSESAKNIEQITLFAGFVLGVAKMMGIKIRWGHDWNQDMQVDTRGLVDRPHYEIVEED